MRKTLRVPLLCTRYRHPRYGDARFLTEIDCCRVKRQPGDRGPKIQLIAGRFTLEAAKRSPFDIDGKNRTSWRRRPVHRARAAPLRSASSHRFKSEQFQNTPHGNPAAYFAKIHARHLQNLVPRTVPADIMPHPEQEKRNPYRNRRTFRASPTIRQPKGLPNDWTVLRTVGRDSVVLCTTNKPGGEKRGSWDGSQLPLISRLF